MPSYGATRQQWAHWSLILGLTADLLPVVSNPAAVIAGESTLKSIGKVPSRYNARGLVVGIKDWTKLQATAAQVEAWSGREDYGICLQTRSIRAFDLDIDDLGLAARVRLRITELLGVLPVRARPGAARCALIARIDGTLRKRDITLAADGVIELLANGQQFIIGGTHESGGRYYWEGGDPDEIPVISLEQLDACWAELAAEFGTEPYRPVLVGGARAPSAAQLGRLNGTPRDHADNPVAVWLAARGWVVGEDDSKLWVACPWSAEHTVDTGGSSTAWFVAGTGGYEQGHFECLHAHCARRSDADFLGAVGYEQSFVEDFGVIAPPALVGRGPAGLDAGLDPAGLAGATLHARAGDADGLVGVGLGADSALVALADPTAAWSLAGPGQGLTSTKVKGKSVWACTATNLTRALATAGWWRRLRWDNFRQELFWSTWGGGELHPWVEEDFLAAQMALEGGNFDRVSRDLLRDAIYSVAHTDGFDSAVDWLTGLAWDGRDRVSGFLAEYFGAVPSAYATAVGRYLWTALAGRVLEPGCKADMVLILQSSVEGFGKSTSIEALAPHRDFFCTVDLSERDDNLTRRLQGILVAEWPELRGLRVRASEAVKGWITQRADRIVPKFKNLAVTLQRRYLLIGTTNEMGFLPEGAGRRRWLPIAVAQADLTRLEADRDQLWAQGAVMFAQAGVEWCDAQNLAENEHEQWTEEEIGVDKVQAWLIENQFEEVSTDQVISLGMGREIRNAGINDQKHAARIMKKLGWKQFVAKEERKSYRVWRLSTLSTL